MTKCEYCHGTTTTDERGNCAACGAPKPLLFGVKYVADNGKEFAISANSTRPEPSVVETNFLDDEQYETTPQEFAARARELLSGVLSDARDRLEKVIPACKLT